MLKPRVLVVHNRYQQAGGEDAVVNNETAMLRRHGHEVVEFIRDNQEIATYSLRRKALLLAATTWSRHSYEQLRTLIRRERPDIAHCHNLVPLVSPSAYYACRDAGVPVVQTLHNYRLLCPAGTLFRDGNTCALCVDHPAAGALRACYRRSHIQTSAVSLMLKTHGRCGTWRRLVKAYVTVSSFSRDLHIAAGFPADRLHVKPNFLERDPGQGQGEGDYALFIGRLTQEKGVPEMLSTWRHLPQVPLRVVGGGPQYERCSALASSVKDGRVTLLGQMSPAETLAQVRSARFLVFPSLWHEPFGMALIEAAACGRPVIASKTGAVPELVVDGITGLLFNPRNSEDFASKVAWAWDHPEALRPMGAAARSRYLQHYTAEQNYTELMKVYEQVLDE